MPTAWRIVKHSHVANAFDGEGARRHGGRWNTTGTAVVYVSESRALAALEILARLQSTRAVSGYVLIPVEFPGSVVEAIDTSTLPEDWQASPPPPSAQRIGDEWAEAKRSLALRVPSALIPNESNYLLNPTHPEFDRTIIGEKEEFELDPRLLGR